MIREPLPYRGRIPGDDRVGLSPQEIEHFKTHGYLVKRGLVDAGDGLRGLLDYVWDHIPPAVLERANPATWVDGPAARMTAAEAQRLGVFQGSSFKLRSPREFGTEPFVLALTAGHPHVRRVAEQFLGRPLRPARRVRGFYITFPKPMKLERKLGPHGDQVASDLAAMVIIDEIPPRCGGFTVWPAASSSAALTSRARTSAASSVAGRKHSSVSLTLPPGATLPAEPGAGKTPFLAGRRDREPLS